MCLKVLSCFRGLLKGSSSRRMRRLLAAVDRGTLHLELLRLRSWRMFYREEGCNLASEVLSKCRRYLSQGHWAKLLKHLTVAQCIVPAMSVVHRMVLYPCVFDLMDEKALSAPRGVVEKLMSLISSLRLHFLLPASDHTERVFDSLAVVASAKNDKPSNISIRCTALTTITALLSYSSPQQNATWLKGKKLDELTKVTLSLASDLQTHPQQEESLLSVNIARDLLAMLGEIAEAGETTDSPRLEHLQPISPSAHCSSGRYHEEGFAVHNQANLHPLHSNFQVPFELYFVPSDAYIDHFNLESVSMVSPTASVYGECLTSSSRSTLVPLAVPGFLDGDWEPDIKHRVQDNVSSDETETITYSPSSTPSDEDAVCFSLVPINTCISHDNKTGDELSDLSIDQCPAPSQESTLQLSSAQSEIEIDVYEHVFQGVSNESNLSYLHYLKCPSKTLGKRTTQLDMPASGSSETVTFSLPTTSSGSEKRHQDTTIQSSVGDQDSDDVIYGRCDVELADDNSSSELFTLTYTLSHTSEGEEVDDFENPLRVVVTNWFQNETGINSEQTFMSDSDTGTNARPLLLALPLPTTNMEDEQAEEAVQREESESTHLLELGNTSADPFEDLSTKSSVVVTRVYQAPVRQADNDDELPLATPGNYSYEVQMPNTPSDTKDVRQ